MEIILKTTIGSILSVVFLFLSGIHFYWGLGGKWGSNAAIPAKMNNERIMQPGLLACFVVALALLCFGLFISVKSGIASFPLPGWVMRYGLWVISILFALRAIGEFKYVGFFKKIKSTRFGQFDTRYYSPLCLAIAVSTIVLALLS
ncbi:MAG TPA: DUF3995 domain-containing protein [Agriterribacter sp.]|nr:DUF3995 domain-containing protein [Agriterribacter sp.]